MIKLVLFNEWRVEYPRRRYLEHDSAEQLNQRQSDLMDNILTIGADGSPIVNANEQFRRLLAHVHAELSLRNMPVPVDYRQKTYVHCKRAAELWTAVALQDGTYLLKFGAAKWMDSLLTRGLFRVTNAKWYDDSSLNPAIRDREIEFTEEMYGATVELPENSRHAIHGQSRRIEIIGNVRRVAESITDFYIACFGMKYDYRLFDDFSREGKQSYDACLVIPEPKRFIEQVRRCGERELPGWEFAVSEVSYRDPHHPCSGIRDVFFTKHFRYAYQREFRMAWIPPRPHESLEPVEFELGSLEHYCRLLIL